MDSYAFSLYSQILKTFWRIFLILLGIAAVVIIFPYVKDVLVMFIVSALFSILLSPLVNYMESRGISRALSILMVMLLIVALLAVTLRLIIPGIIRAVNALTEELQSGVITDMGSKVEAFFDKNFHNPELARNVTGKLNELGIQLLGSLGKFFKSVGSFVASMVIIPVITFFLIKDWRKFKRALIARVPNRYFELTLNILHKAGHQVGRYIQGQALVALNVGVLSIIGLLIINLVFERPVPYFVFVGMLAGLANLVPYLGPFMGAVPAIILAIFSNPPNLPVVLLWIVVMFVIVQAIDNTLISPLVVSKSANVHPLTVIVVVLIGGKIAGAMGMLFAVPFWGIIKVVSSQIMWGIKNYSLGQTPGGKTALEAGGK